MYLHRRADEAAAKKEASGKKKEALKSAIIIDVKVRICTFIVCLTIYKPWDDTTDLAKMEEAVRSIVMDGLEWKACKRYCHY
jgi:elongation factor 1-beta